MGQYETVIGKFLISYREDGSEAYVVLMCKDEELYSTPYVSHDEAYAKYAVMAHSITQVIYAIKLDPNIINF